MSLVVVDRVATWIKYLSDKPITIRLLQDPDDWTYWWEHFGNTGSYPCTNEESCPGCTSDNEKKAKASRRVSFNVLESYNGNEYVNVYKFGTMVADKLTNRYQRFDTLTDRDYTISRYKTSGDRWDFDVEGAVPTPIDPSKYEFRDVEKMLAQAYDDAKGENAKPRRDPWAQPGAKEPQQAQKANTGRAAPALAVQPSPKEESPRPTDKEYAEADLRKMELSELTLLIKDEMGVEAPATADTPDKVVDWLLEIQSG